MTDAAETIKAKIGAQRIDAAVVLGTGLGALTDVLGDPVTLAYGDLAGFPKPSVEGHAGSLVIGTVGTRRIAMLRGRAHAYETGRCDGMMVAFQTLKALGCQTMMLTNSAGSLNPQAGPGSLVMITDHINYAGMNPLTGQLGNDRFVDMTTAYDEDLRHRCKATARTLNIDLHEGVYMWFAGPSFETPAEIRMAKILGADLVGMSTVPEVILARWLGLKVVAFSAVANAAAGMGGKTLDHETSLSQSAKGAKDLVRLLGAVLENDDD